MLTKRSLLGATAVAMLGAPAAMAATATATTDLNLRAGPGPQHEIITVIDGLDQAEVDGCIAETNWCRVTYEGHQGWAFGDYLSGSPEKATKLKVTTIERDDVVDEGDGAAIGAVTGASLAGSLVGGPAAVATGLVLGAEAGAEAAEGPEERVVSYVVENPVEPVYLSGEVVVGATIPENVAAYDIPETDYEYLNVNGQHVLVNDENRQIVYINR